MLLKHVFSCRVSHVFKLHILPLLLVKPSPLCLKSTVFIHVYQLFWCKSTFGRLTPLCVRICQDKIGVHPHFFLRASLMNHWICGYTWETMWYHTLPHREAVASSIQLLGSRRVITSCTLSSAQSALATLVSHGGFSWRGTVGRWKGVLGTDIDKVIKPKQNREQSWNPKNEIQHR